MRYGQRQIERRDMQFDPLDLIFEHRHLLRLSRETNGLLYRVSRSHAGAVESSQLERKKKVNNNFVVNSFSLTHSSFERYPVNRKKKKCIRCSTFGDS